MYWITLIFLLGNIILFQCLPSAAERLQPYYEKEITVVGRVEPLSIKERDNGQSFILRCEEITVAGQGFSSKDRLRVFVKEKVELQGQVEVRGILKELNGNYNPGCFDMEKWNKVNRIGGRISQAQIRVKTNTLTVREQLEEINRSLRKTLSSQLENRHAAIMGGMLLGGGGALEETDRERFSDQGMAHLLSVSGAHLILWTGLLDKLLGFIAFKKRRCLILLLLGSYVLLCGARPPVLRAWLMSGLLLWGEGESKRGYLLCLVAMVLLAFNPLWIWDMGFQLSFGATAGLILFLPKCQELWQRVLPKSLEFLGEGLGVTLAAQLLVVPLEIAYFHQVSLVSVVSNLVLVPVLEVVNILTATGLLMSEILGWNGLLKLGGWLLEGVLAQSSEMERWPWITVVIGYIPLWTVLVYYAFLGCWADIAWFKLLKNRERRWGMVCLVSVLVLTYGYYHWLSGPMQVYFMDVGQGDGAIVLTPQKKVVVIDTGGLKGFDTGSRIVVPVLKYLGKSKVDLLIVSHTDQDHIGGGAGLGRNVKVERMLLPQENFSKESAERLNGILKYSTSCEVKYANKGDCYEIGGIMAKIVDAPAEKSVGNDASTVVEISNGSNKILFTGDIGFEREIRVKNLEGCDVLKVAHHGSKYSSNAHFLEQVNPKLAVISCGKDNGYGHPHRETLARLSAVGTKTLRTDEKGCIIVEFANQKIRTRTWKKGGKGPD